MAILSDYPVTNPGGAAGTVSANTEQALPDVGGGMLLIRADPNNTGNVTVGPLGTVNVSGFENLKPGQLTIRRVRDSTTLAIISATAPQQVHVTNIGVI